MTLDELRAQLAALDLPGDTPVILTRDPEGNGFSPLATVDDAWYAADSPYSGEWHATPQMREAAPDDWDEPPHGATVAVFLWPAS